MQNIYGALSAYLMIGVAFAAFFTAIDHLSGGNFFAQGQPDSTQTFQYFSFTTLTTLGYGDFTAAATSAEPWRTWKRSRARYSWLPSWPSWSRGSGHPASRNADQPVPEVTSPESYAARCDPSPNPIATEPVTDPLTEDPCYPSMRTAGTARTVAACPGCSGSYGCQRGGDILRMYPGATASPPASGDPDCGRRFAHALLAQKPKIKSAY